MVSSIQTDKLITRIAYVALLLLPNSFNLNCETLTFLLSTMWLDGLDCGRHRIWVTTEVHPQPNVFSGPNLLLTGTANV